MSRALTGSAAVGRADFGAPHHRRRSPNPVDEGQSVPNEVTPGTPPSVLVTIRDADGPAPSVPSVRLSASPNPVDEGQSAVTATLSRALPGSVTVPLVLTRGTAESGDFGSLASITISGGGLTGTGTVTTTDDTDEDDETFTVALGSLPNEVTPGTPSSVLVTIRDADGPPPSPSVRLSASPNPVDEGVGDGDGDAVGCRGATVPLVLTAGTAESGDFGSLASITISGGDRPGRARWTTTRRSPWRSAICRTR